MPHITTLSVQHQFWRDTPTLTAWTIQEEPSTRISWTPRAPARPKRLRRTECREVLYPNNALPGIYVHGTACRCAQPQTDNELQDTLLAAKIAFLTRTVLAPTTASTASSTSSTATSRSGTITPPPPPNPNHLKRSHSRSVSTSSLRSTITRLFSPYTPPRSHSSLGTTRTPTASISLPLQADLTIGCAELDIDKVARYLLPLGDGCPSATAGVDVNAPNHHGTTPLMAAVRSSPHRSPVRGGQQPLPPRGRARLEMVRFLVEACGADVEAAGEDSVLRAACTVGAADVVRFLIASGADVGRRLQCAKGPGSGKGKKTGQTALHAAILADRPECVEVLLHEGGADANAVFDAAAAETDDRVSPDRGIRNSLRGRAKASVSRERRDKGLKNPVSALHIAANGSSDCARLLLEYGASVDVRDRYGQTPLHWAAKAGNELVVRLLVEAGADVDAVSDDSVTPLEQLSRDG
ncbi:ankyrin repeat-containing domain protein [Corynascus similis CBS 632.67]